jgi:methionyl aminopeptidase
MIEMYKKAGKIVSRVRRMAINQVKEDLKVIDLVEFVENQTLKLGGKPAFPCNVSINEITAHYTSPPDDEKILKTGDLVKIDIGAHVDGYIADTAISVMVEGEDGSSKDLEKSAENHWMIETADEALESAISTIKSGVEVGKIGEIIEKTITNRRLKAVSNLTGHSMDRWILHSGLSIPNIKESNPHKIEEGDILAIEPFVTNGVGRVTDTKDVYIFRFLRDRPLRVIHAKRLLNMIKKDYKNLPFAKRWLLNHSDERRLNASIRQLTQTRAIYPYHVLKEKSDAKVAQAEHTIIVESDGCMIITE